VAIIFSDTRERRLQIVNVYDYSCFNNNSIYYVRQTIRNCVDIIRDKSDPSHPLSVFMLSTTNPEKVRSELPPKTFSYRTLSRTVDNAYQGMGINLKASSN